MDTALRELVRSPAGGRCEYCHLPEQFSELYFHIEHIIPGSMVALMALKTWRWLVRSATW